MTEQQDEERPLLPRVQAALARSKQGARADFETLLGHRAADLGDHKLARAMAEKAAAIDPDHPVTSALLAALQARLGLDCAQERALRSLDKLEQLKTNDERKNAFLVGLRALALGGAGPLSLAFLTAFWLSFDALPPHHQAAILAEGAADFIRLDLRKAARERTLELVHRPIERINDGEGRASLGDTYRRSLDCYAHLAEALKALQDHHDLAEDDARAFAAVIERCAPALEPAFLPMAILAYRALPSAHLERAIAEGEADPSRAYPRLLLRIVAVFGLDVAEPQPDEIYALLSDIRAHHCPGGCRRFGDQTPLVLGGSDSHRLALTTALAEHADRLPPRLALGLLRQLRRFAEKAEDLELRGDLSGALAEAFSRLPATPTVKAQLGGLHDRLCELMISEDLPFLGWALGACLHATVRLEGAWDARERAEDTLNAARQVLAHHEPHPSLIWLTHAALPALIVTEETGDEGGREDVEAFIAEVTERVGDFDRAELLLKMAETLQGLETPWARERRFAIIEDLAGLPLAYNYEREAAMLAFDRCLWPRGLGLWPREKA